MADVKWIKITTDIFSDEKILLIEQMPDADTMIVIWFKLLCMAGKENNYGIFTMANRMPYTEEMLATIFRRPLNTVRLALSTFEAFGMIEIEDDIICIANWEKHQNIDGMEKIREQNRIRKRKQREKEKIAQLEDSHVKSRDGHATDKIRKEEDKNRLEVDKSINYQQIADMYNEICISFPRIRTLSDSRKKTIKARLNKYSVEDIREVFVRAEGSDFLKGANGRDWSADFDWLMKDSNIAKVLEGKYSNKKGESHEHIGANAKGYDASEYYGDMQSDFNGF